MIHFNSTPAREYLTALRLCPNVKSKTNLAISETSTTLSLLDDISPSVLGVSHHAMRLLYILNDMDGCGIFWRRLINEQAAIWQDMRLTQLQVRSRSLKEIANLLEAFWFTNMSLKNL